MNPRILLFVLAITACEICYTQNKESGINTTVLSLCDPEAADAYLPSGTPTTNFGNHPSLGGNTWTCIGNLCLSRGLFKFNLSGIPANATVTSAYLKVYADLLWYQYPTTGGPQNSGTLCRVTSSWNEMTVTWATQPSTTALNQVTIPGSTSTAQDYTLTVTNLVQDMLSNGNNGFMLKMDDEVNYYKSLMFASSDNADALKCPQLEVNYTTGPTATGLMSYGMAGAVWNVFPSPFQEKLNIASNVMIGNITITNIAGSVVMNRTVNSRDYVLKNDLAGGIYYLQIYDVNGNLLGTKKILRSE